MDRVSRLRKHLLGATLVATAAMLASGAAVHASSLTVNPVPQATDVFDAENGQSIPTGTGGYVDGTLNVTVAGLYLFTYGPPGLVAGATGHGDSTYTNDFWVGTSLANAISLGQVFCTQAGTGCGAASVVGDSFAVNLPVGPVDFGFTFGPTFTDTLTNGGSSAEGAYLVQIGLGTSPNFGPGDIAYLGLSDRPYPGIDHDFQDLTVSVSSTPLPAALPLFTTGLGALGVLGWRRRRKAALMAA